VVTAPRLASVASLFKHAAVSLPDAEFSRGSLKLADGRELLFEPPDRLVHADIPCDLLLVDEAAAIPAPLLEHMLRRHPRIAFATTVHGYEGTGRGFDLRFSKVLDEVTPEWRRLRLEQPIRWAGGDPLEQRVFRALLLDAEPASDEAVANITLHECRIERLDRDLLAADEVLLSQLFGLLVLAHYRTSPGDLRNLLDGPNLEIVVLRQQEKILATALLAVEGGFDRELSHQVYEGQRRLRGNLLPQSLTVHAGLAEAACLRGVRVMRIAVHPARQGEGFGSLLIEEVAALAREEGFDYLGASFGATPELLDFWRRQECLPVRLGLKREASSGMHAAMVMRPLSPAGHQLFIQARQRLARQLPLLLSEPLCELESLLVERLLLEGAGGPPLSPDESLWADVTSFALARRDYGNCLLALHSLLLVALTDRCAVEQLSPMQRALLIAKVLQRRPWQTLVHEHALRGREEAMEQLRAAYRQLCRYYDPS
jgi:tRNA(Met) cytidine acetyltransferase